MVLPIILFFLERKREGGEKEREGRERERGERKREGVRNGKR